MQNEEEDRIFKYFTTPSKYRFGNTTYKTDNTVTDADKEREEFNLEKYLRP